MIGVNFQPGQSGYGNGSPKGDNVQEAIKVLSLRLPKVVGAQGIAPSALMNSMGGGGSRVDSVVNQVLARMFPTGMPPGQVASFGVTPEAPGSGPSFSGSAQPSYQSQQPETSSYQSPQYVTPRLVFEGGMNMGDFTLGADGRPKTSPFGASGIFESLPGTNHSQPPASIAPLQPWPSGGSYQDEGQPLI